MIRYLEFLAKCHACLGETGPPAEQANGSRPGVRDAYGSKYPTRRYPFRITNTTLNTQILNPEGPSRRPIWNSAPKNHIWYGFWALIPYRQSKWTLWEIPHIWMLPTLRDGFGSRLKRGTSRPGQADSDAIILIHVYIYISLDREREGEKGCMHIYIHMYTTNTQDLQSLYYRDSRFLVGLS